MTKRIIFLHIPSFSDLTLTYFPLTLHDYFDFVIMAAKPPDMNPIEAEYLLTGLKRLLDELKVRKVTAPESIFLGDSDNTYLWTIKKAIWEIWQEAEEM